MCGDQRLSLDVFPDHYAPYTLRSEFRELFSPLLAYEIVMVLKRGIISEV